jgi:threonine/homoserine/homoserine lactone efflux protein
MSEALITIILSGLIAGFVFSMPIAGPVSILVTSNALKGNLSYCNRLTVGASFADFFYVFIAVFGLTKYYHLYKPAIPYVMIAGAVFIFFTGYKIFRTKIDKQQFDGTVPLHGKILSRERGGFYTGFFVNFLNPTLFFGWLTTSFIVISIVSSLGFDTGGLDLMIDNSINELNNTSGHVIQKPDLPSYLKFDTLQILKKEQSTVILEKHQFRNYPMIVSVCFSAALSFGSILWFFFLAFFIYRYHEKISLQVLNFLIRSLGVILCIVALFIGYRTIFPRFFA